MRPGSVEGLLLDLDGVLYVGDTPIDGAVAAIERIHARGLPCRFVTNTSTLSLHSLQHKLAGLGFNVPRAEIISAPQAALLYLRNHPGAKCRLLLAEDVRRDFAQLPQSDADPSHVLIGDIGDNWSYALLNDVFRQLMAGARLIAIHKNRFWQTGDGLRLDIGGFVHALEYASGVRATIIGKPAPDFYAAALQDLGLPASKVAMVGDDIDVDVGGAQACGLKGVLVRTGKYRTAYAQASQVRPDLVLDSVASLPGALGL